MYKQTILFCAGVVCLGALNQALAQEQNSFICEDASGKITNNAQLGGSTLGVVALKLGQQKLKCGITGQPQAYPSEYNFIHTIACDDKASTDSAQAQVSFNTKFTSQSNVTPCPGGSPGGPISFSFEEVSTPILGSGRGAFKGVTGGSLDITGNYNCDGGIVMKFDGQMCYSPLP